LVGAGFWCLTADARDADAGGRARVFETLAGDVWGGESVLLSTCQRVELYGTGRPLPARPPGTRLLLGTEAARHLFRVAAGLESAVAGESEILGQVRRAYREAAARPLDGSLARLFEAAIATGRRCRSGRGPSGSSLAALAALTLQERMPPGLGPVLVVGAGYMGAAIAAALSPRCQVVIASRTLERALAVAARHRLTAVGLDSAEALAPQARGLAVALAAPWQARFRAGSLPPAVDVSSPPALEAAASADYTDIDALLALGSAAADGYAARAARVVESDLAAYLDSCRRRASEVAV
jgi:glutamyl-tRNA reductase